MNDLIIRAVRRRCRAERAQRRAAARADERAGHRVDRRGRAQARCPTPTAKPAWRSAPRGGSWSTACCCPPHATVCWRRRCSASDAPSARPWPCSWRPATPSQIPRGLLDPVRTLTANIASEMGEVSQGSDHYHVLFLIGVLLFCITFVVNVTADLVVRGIEEGSRVRGDAITPGAGTARGTRSLAWASRAMALADHRARWCSSSGIWWSRPGRR